MWADLIEFVTHLQKNKQKHWLCDEAIRVQLEWL